jgi:endonuclease/exonuclease/phosphatase family metal-dependent hydrolase
MAYFRSQLMTLFKVVTVVFLFFYLPSCFVYLVSPSQWWFMGILAIAFPYLWLFLLILVLSWVFIRRRSAAILLLLLICGLPIMRNVFAVHVNKEITPAKTPGKIRLMQWNCNGLQGYWPINQELITERAKAVQFLRTYNPDIICIQDFSNVIANIVKSNIALLQDSLGYRYFLYTQHYKMFAKNYSDGIGIAIFSKFPILDSGKISYPGKKKPESILWAGFDIGGKKLRIATTHLQSMHLSGKDSSGKLSPDHAEDSLLILHGNVWQKLRYFQSYHVTQAQYLRKFIDTCSGPLILTADLNSVPSSLVYNTVRQPGLKDVFMEFGFGFGRTYQSLQPALRIDYIFHNSFIVPAGASLYRTSFSDHDPLIMDFSIR